MKIFISYRRSDTRHLAGRLSDVLRTADNVDEVFIDVESIAPGAQFEHEMISALEASDVCLALMGDGWTAGQRIQEPNDPVRLEIQAALSVAESGRLNLTPVLVDGAPMPDPAALPPDLRPVAKRNGRPLNHATFQTDLLALARGLGIELAPQVTLAQRIGRTLLGVAAAAGILLFGLLVHRWLAGQSLETTLGGTPAVIAVVAAALATGGVAPHLWPGWRRR